MSDTRKQRPDFSGAGPVDYRPEPPAAAGPVATVFASEEARLLAIPGVTSVGIGHGPAGEDALTVGVVDSSVATRLPRAINGVPVVVTVTGPVDAL